MIKLLDILTEKKIAATKRAMDEDLDVGHQDDEPRMLKSELARTAKEKYKLNPEFPDMEDRIKNPSNYKDDRRQQIINYFVSQAKDQGVEPTEVELLKSKIEKETVPGKSFTLIPDLKQNLLRSTSVKPVIALLGALFLRVTITINSFSHSDFAPADNLVDAVLIITAIGMGADTLDKFSSPSKKKNAEDTPAE
jgi:hypothetical protein